MLLIVPEMPSSRNRLISSIDFLSAGPQIIYIVPSPENASKRESLFGKGINPKMGDEDEKCESYLK